LVNGKADDFEVNDSPNGESKSSWSHFYVPVFHCPLLRILLPFLCGTVYDQADNERNGVDDLVLSNVSLVNLGNLWFRQKFCEPPGAEAEPNKSYNDVGDLG